jgi:predicted transcriptional regulator
MAKQIKVPEGEAEAKETKGLKSYVKYKVRPVLDDDGNVAFDKDGKATPKKIDEPIQSSKIEAWAVEELNSQWLNTGFYYFEA